MRRVVVASMLVLSLFFVGACADEDVTTVETAAPTAASPTVSITPALAATAAATRAASVTPTLVPTVDFFELVGKEIEVWVYADAPRETGACIDVLPALVPVGEIDVVDAVVGRCTFDGRTFARVAFVPTGQPGVLALRAIDVLLLVKGPDAREPCGGPLDVISANDDPTSGTCLTVRWVVPHVPGDEPAAARLIWAPLPESARGLEVPQETHCRSLMRLFNSSPEEATPVRARCLLD